MASGWLTLFLLIATSLAAQNKTETQWDYEWPEGSTEWHPDLKPCAEKWMPMCYQWIENTIFVPILCLCGQDRTDNEFLVNFAQCIGETAPNRSESGFMGLQYECSQEGLSVNMTRNEFMRIAAEGVIDNTASKSLSGGAIAGIVVGAIAGVAAVIGVLVWLWLQRRKKNGDKLESNPPSSPKPENSSTWNTEFKPEWTTNAPVELPPKNHQGTELPPDSAPVYEMEAIPVTPVEMPSPIPDNVNKCEKT
ncbi:c2h2 type zinc finger containing [Fusarium longipes]|uniref:C2h2 type zinc finger containing n=1 Tax=Fusarium longipes TaxID=694270 RepID=A0A395T5K8_9HYPO|nr:c2h2 type zinc finger containing [Fusarium longipes]